MSALKQISAVTWMNLCNLPQRAGNSLVVVIGIGGVVAVLVGVLAMAAGMIDTLKGATRPERIIVMSGGATSEVTSFLGQNAARLISEADSIRREADGTPAVSAEVLRPVKVVRSDTRSETTAILRGVGTEWQRVRPEIKIVSGRTFSPGVREAIVGKALASRFEGLKIGSAINAAGVTWRVVGGFTSDGDAHESEILADAATVQSAYHRIGFNSVTVSLESPADLEDFERTMNLNASLRVSVIREEDFHARQSRTLTTLISVIAYVIGGIMGVGALFGALNTMYSAVSTRTREIATLRALGYGPAAMVVSVLIEAMMLALVGGLIGVFIAWWYVRGTTASTPTGDWGVQFVFGITVTPVIMIVGLAWAAGIGLVGGLLPALRAARLPVATALRAL